MVTPRPFDDPADGLFLRLFGAKESHGHLEGTGKWHVLTTGPGTSSSGACVAPERVSGKVNGKRGSFVLAHRFEGNQPFSVHPER